MQLSNWLLVICCVIGPCVAEIFTLALGGTAAAAAAIAAGYASYELYLKCQIKECCHKTWVRHEINAGELSNDLEQQVHGQHIAVKHVKKYIKLHVENPNPSKALVLSFNGGTGTGKNFISNIIAKHMFTQGTKSSYVHLINALQLYPHKKEEYLTIYKDDLKRRIEKGVTACERSLFIFDEVDELPVGLIDVIKPYLEGYPHIDNADYKRAVFLLLSNIGATSINKFVVDHLYSGKTRDSITQKDLRKTVSFDLEALNQQGGLRRSSLIAKDMVTAYIPFLPLERSHVRMCIRDLLYARDSQMEFKKLNKISDEVIDELTFFPKDEWRFATKGCKKVPESIDFLEIDDF